MSDYERGYRAEFRSIGSGDRTLEVVSGKSFSATQIYALPPPSQRSADPPPPFHHRDIIRKSSSSSAAWCFSDPEMKRRRRVASYKSYAVEGKVKSSFRKGFRWIKGKCSEIVHGL